MDIDFREVNDFLESQGFQRFPFDTIHIDIADENAAREMAAHFNNLLLDWLSAQEIRG